MARTQPPVGLRIALSQLVRGVYRVLSTRDCRESFEAAVARHFGVRHVFAVSSGKAALTLILQVLHARTGRTKVIVPAYTCYSVPSSIAKAGLDVVPCDIAPGLFDYDYERLLPLLGRDVLCVLSVHLFGIPSDIRRLNELCRKKGIFVVEDAAQAMGGTSEGTPLGTLGDVGFFSLGRGKNITCGSGGVIVTDSEPIASGLAEPVSAIPVNGVADDLRTLTTLLLMSIFIAPDLYWVPAGLPFLRLGETIFYEAFPVRRLSGFQAALLDRWPERLAELDMRRRENARFYIGHMKGVRHFGEDIPYLRFPVLVNGAEERQRILVRNGGRALGMSAMYPTPVSGIRQLEGRLPAGRFPEAERLVASLVTLPTHALLSSDERSKICALLNPVADQSLPLRKVQTLS